MSADTAVVGVMSLRGAALEELVPVFEQDYAHLNATYPEFLSGRLVASSSDPIQFFHLTEWSSRAALAAAREDPTVLALFDSLPSTVVVESHVCEPVVRSGGRA